MEEEREMPDSGFGEDEDWIGISKNRFMNNLMVGQASYIMDIFERFLKEKGIEIPNKAKKEASNRSILCENDYASIENEVEEVLEDLLHQARREFEEEFDPEDEAMEE